MTILEKIEKALEFLRSPDNASKTNDLQSYSGALGQCMGILGGHFSMIQPFSTLLQQSIPILLSLCSHNNAEVRLVADEALNRIVISSIPFHSSKLHLHFHNSITSDKHPRWLRAALSRVYLGQSWLRAGTGRGRIFAQSTLIRLKDIVERVKDPILIAEKGDTLLMESLETNLPRIMKALSQFATRDEMFGLLSTLLTLVDSPTAPIRRNTANCIADLCQYYQKKFIPHVVNAALGILQEKSASQNAILGWFGTLRMIFYVNPIKTLDNDVLPIIKYMQIYQICLHFTDVTKTDHNILNATMDCLNVLLSESSPALRSELLNPKGPVCLINTKEKYIKSHQRSLSSVSMVHSILSTASSTANLSDDMLISEQSDSLVYQGTILGSISQIQTPHRSMEDLSMRGINTPDSPCESMISELNSDIMTTEQFSIYVKEKLSEKSKEQETDENETLQAIQDDDINIQLNKETNEKIDIGSFNDADVSLKYCARLLVSRFLLSGFADKTISDRMVRVSVKASALTCLISVIDIYPEIMMLYLSIQNDVTHHNISGNSEVSTTSNIEQLNDFVLERNICYQESLTDSFGQELLSKSIDLSSQASGSGSHKSGISHKLSSIAQKKDKCKTTANDSMENSLAGLPSNMLDSKQQSIASNPVQNQMASSIVSGDSFNHAMTGSNFTMGSHTTSNYPASTDFLSTSIDPLTSSLDLEMIFDHFGESSTSIENPTNPTEIEQRHASQFNLEQMFQELLITNENVVKYDKQISNESKKSNQSKSDETKNSPAKGITTDIQNTNPEVAMSEESPKKCKIIPQKEAVEQNKNDSASIDICEAPLDIFESEPTNQHLSEIIFLLQDHPDPQIRGLIRVCIGTFINAVFESSSGDYSKWKSWINIPKVIVDKMTTDKLLEIVLMGLTDTIHSCVNHSISTLKRCCNSICNGHPNLIIQVLNSLRCVENNPSWLCKVNLCQFYATLDYQRLSILISDWSSRCFLILDILIQFLSDQDQRVRKAATEAIIRLPPFFHPTTNFDANSMLTNLALNQTEKILFTKLKSEIKLLADFKHSFVLSVLPNPLKELNGEQENAYLSENDLLYTNLKAIIHVLSYKLMLSQCKYLTQGCLEALLQLSLQYPPTKFRNAYSGLGLFEMCLQLLEYRTLSVSCCEILLAFATQIYSMEAWNAMCQKNNTDKQSTFISMPSDNQKSWNQFGSTTFAGNAATFLKLTLKLLNILIHIIQDITPVMINQRISGIIPQSPIRKRSDDNQKTNTTSNSNVPSEEKNKRRSQFNTTSGNYLALGYFINDVTLMKLYGSLKSAYSSHKVNTDPTTSIFLNFMSHVLDSLAIQLEMMSEKEAGKLIEEVLFYLKYLLPLRPDRALACLTQLIKCLFSINMAAHRSNLQTFFTDSSYYKKNKWDDDRESKKPTFYNDVLLTNKGESLSFDSILTYNDKMFTHLSDSSENRLNCKIAEGFGRNSHLESERECYLSIKNYIKSKTDKEWTTHKQECVRYIKLLEPIIIQALKSYNIQNNMFMQCKVLELMNQLLKLHINYSFLDNDRVLVDLVLRQLELIERCEMFDCGELVHCIFTFLVHLSSADHHTKQLMDIPKLIQLCDGLMASDVYEECVQALHPLTYKVFVFQQQIPGQSRIQIQEAQVTKEVLFAMLQKMMRDPKVINLISSVLIFSEEHPESHFKWSQLACDTLFQLMKQKHIEINDAKSFVYLDKLFDCIHREVLFDQTKIEASLRIMFEKPPDQENATLEIKERWLATILLFLHKIIFNLAENEILLSLNYLKTSHISPAAIFFNSHNEIDPLNVQTVNENCANLSPDVIFVRFLFRIITYALVEIENCDVSDLNEDDTVIKSPSKKLSYWCKITVSLISQVKHILYLKDGCRFPLLAKTAQIVLQNEQSGLNTGLYSPEENIPLKKLGTICTRVSWKQPLLAIHWCHLLVRLKFLEQKYWSTLLRFLHNSTPSMEANGKNLYHDILQIGCFITLCEHFVDNGLDEVVNLTWMLVNRIHYLVRYYDEAIVKEFVSKINENPSASGLLLQAIAAKCQPYIKGTYGLKVYSILSNCHESQSGSLLFCICRFIGKLPISNSYYFARLAIKQCQYLTSLSIDEANTQIPLDDLQLAMEMLHNNRVDKRYPELADELNKLASSIYNLSPLDIPLNRHISPQNIKTTRIDSEWFLSQVKTRCYKYSNDPVNYGKLTSIAKSFKLLTSDELNSIFNSTEFDAEIIQQTLIIGSDTFIKELIDKLSEQEFRKVERRRLLIEKHVLENADYYVKDSFLESNILNISNIPRFRKNRKQSQFFISIDDSSDKAAELKKIDLNIKDEKSDVSLPEFTPLLTASLKHFQKLVLSVVSLFPKHVRPLSQFEMGTLKDYQTMDKYTKRCFLVFRDKFFHQLLTQVQNLVLEYLNCFKSIQNVLIKMDPDIIDKAADIFLPKNLAHNLMLFSIISLQYTSYLIKQSEDSLFLNGNNGTLKNEFQNIDYIMDLCVKNASECFSISSIWKELNVNDNRPRVLSAINCLYNYVKYVLKDTLPLRFSPTVSTNEKMEETAEMAITCDKLLTLIQYWQDNFYQPNGKLNNIMSLTIKENIETLIVYLCRCTFANTFTLIPPLAWNEVELFELPKKKCSGDDPLPNDSKAERVLKTDIQIPINALQDMDVLEQFLFRVNMIGWICKKGFEEIWVSFLGALQGNGTHWAVRGMMQLLLSASYKNCGRGNTLANMRIKRLKQVGLDCKFYDILFSDVNLETVPYKDCSRYHFSQISIDYLKHASGILEFPDIKVQNMLSQSRRQLKATGIDINSCIFLLIDIATQVLTQPDWGLGARNALLCCIVNVSDIFTTTAQWEWLSSQLSTVSNLTETTDILTQQYVILGQAKVQSVLGTDVPDSNQLVATLSSSFAPTRIAAFESAIMYLSSVNHLNIMKIDPNVRINLEHFHSVLEMHLLLAIQPHLVPNAVISYYEQSLCWVALFTLVEGGNNELFKVAVEFLFSNPNHFCFDLILRGICNATLAKGGYLTNEIRSAIFKIVDAQPEECFKFLPLLMTQIYSGNDIQSGENTLEPEQLLVHLQTFASLQKSAILSNFNSSKNICKTLVYCLKDFLPPAAMLNKVVQEFIDCCRWADTCLDKSIAKIRSNVGLYLAPGYVEMMGNVVFEVFEASIAQDQLLIFNGWLFDVLSHLLQGKISPGFTPFCLLCLITCASSNQYIRALAPIVNYTLKTGCATNSSSLIERIPENTQSVISIISRGLPLASRVHQMSFDDMRLLCLGAVHSNFTKFQIEKIKSMCVGETLLDDLRLSLDS